MNKLQTTAFTLTLISMFASSISGTALAHDGKGKGRDGGFQNEQLQQVKKEGHKDRKDHKVSRDNDHEDKAGNNGEKDKKGHESKYGQVELTALITANSPDTLADWNAFFNQKEELHKQLESLKKALKGIQLPALTEDQKQAEKAAHDTAEKAEEEAKKALYAAVFAKDTATIKTALASLLIAEKAELALEVAKFEALKKLVPATPTPTVAPTTTPTLSSLVLPTSTPKPIVSTSKKTSESKSKVSFVLRVKQALLKK